MHKNIQQKNSLLLQIMHSNNQPHIVKKNVNYIHYYDCCYYYYNNQKKNNTKKENESTD